MRRALLLLMAGHLAACVGKSRVDELWFGCKNDDQCARPAVCNFDYATADYKGVCVDPDGRQPPWAVPQPDVGTGDADVADPDTSEDVAEEVVEDGGPDVPEVADPCPDGCDDGVECTADNCTDQGCENDPRDEACDDGVECTEDGFCHPTDGCSEKAPLHSMCDDGSPCLEWECMEVVGCKSTLLDSVPCDDGDSCEGSDTCVAGVCESGCADGDPCTQDSCYQGQCLYGDPCDDKLDCTQDGCSEGDCSHLALDDLCEDGSPCLDWFCVLGTGCESVIGAGVCDDGDPCTQADVCDEAGACGGAALACEDDGDPCTQEGCSGCPEGWWLGAGSCFQAFQKVGTHQEAEAACVGHGGHLASIANDEEAFVVGATAVQVCGPEDAFIGMSDKGAVPWEWYWFDGSDVGYFNWAEGEPAPEGKGMWHAAAVGLGGKWVTLPINSAPCYVCEVAADPTEGSCTKSHPNCDDGVECTDDICQSGCQSLPYDSQCDDGDDCTDDTCELESGCAFEPVDCDDQDPCTADACETLCDGGSMVQGHCVTGDANQPGEPGDLAEKIPLSTALAACADFGGDLMAPKNESVQAALVAARSEICGVVPNWLPLEFDTGQDAWFWLDGDPVSYQSWEDPAGAADPTPFYSAQMFMDGAWSPVPGDAPVPCYVCSKAVVGECTHAPIDGCE